MATRVRAGWSDKTVMGASRTGSYEVTATRPDVREDATGHGRQISAKTARRRSLPRVRPRPMAPQTSSLSPLRGTLRLSRVTTVSSTVRRVNTAEHSATVTVTGHLMDTGILARILDDVLEYGGDYRIESLDLGKQHDNESRALIEIRADEADLLDRILMRVQVHGANAVDPRTALTRPAPADGVFPEDFYSTTNLETLVRLDREWLRVRQPEMDCGLVVTEEDGQQVVRTVPVSDVRAGDTVVCGAHGVRVELPPQAPRGEEDDFGFMSSAVSSEKPQALLVRQIAERMREVKAAGRRILWVGGPAVVHTGASPAMVRLVRAGYVDVLFAGNALATHDIESALFGTSLGVDLAKGSGVP